jgi:hypothetical protein
MEKEEILAEIRRTAEENGGKPLGTRTFEKETGIGVYDWARYWARFGDAQKEAGFTPNQLKSAYDEEYLITKAISIIRELNKFPIFKEIRIARIANPEIPDATVFQTRFGSKVEFARKIVKFCESKTGFDDVIELCKPVVDAPSPKTTKEPDVNERLGEVYLFKSGRHYKIGMTKDTVRRGSELRIQLPERMDLIHSIKTDDPSGIEAYWHRRFASKRMNGEWFDLNSADIKAFKRWRRI